jgi:flagella basal body P-ring formation protein FlgA
MKCCLLLAMTAVMCRGECLPVATDYIRGRDMAVAFPVFAALAPEARLLISPSAGVERHLRAAEVVNLAKRFNLGVADARDVCFTWRLRPVSAAAIKNAIEAAASSLDAHLTILETPEIRAPEGTLDFAPSGLREVDRQNGVFLWSGWFRYGETRRLPLWAKVRLSVADTHIVAARDLPAETAVTADDLIVTEYERALNRSLVPMTPDQVIGKRTRSRITRGTAILVGALAPIPAVNIGDTVQVDAFDGAAHLVLTAKAEKSGAVGELIYLRNPQSGKRFTGRINGPGRVNVGGSR